MSFFIHFSVVLLETCSETLISFWILMWERFHLLKKSTLILNFHKIYLSRKITQRKKEAQVNITFKDINELFCLGYIVKSIVFTIYNKISKGKGKKGILITESNVNNRFFINWIWCCYDLARLMYRVIRNICLKIQEFTRNY